MTCTATNNRTILHVEVLLRPGGGTFVRTDGVREEVFEWILGDFACLKINDELSGFGRLTHAAQIERIQVVQVSGEDNDTGVYTVDDIDVDVQAYELHERDSSPMLADDQHNANEDDQENPQDRQAALSTVLVLPNLALKDEWDSLVFDSPIQQKLLSYATKMLSLTKISSGDTPGLQLSRVILLHGPPGTGKTSLCRGLAQKLAIRMSNHFESAQLSEINANALLSKWFSESAKVIAATFSQIMAAAARPSTLVCVLLDEVESVAGSRSATQVGQDCRDGLRATNQLLTALDRLSKHSNVLVLCTSNMVDMIDPAFMDRVDIKMCVPKPSTTTIYSILRSCLNDLVSLGLITTGSPLQEAHESTACIGGVNDDEMTKIPTFDDLQTRMWHEEQAPGRILWTIAHQCDGLSGRTLRRLPFLAVAMHTVGSTCCMDDALRALRLAASEAQGS